MNSIKFNILVLLLTWSIHSFCQTHYDSTFIHQIINLELKENDKKIKKAYPIFETSTSLDDRIRKDSVYTQDLFGKEMNWTAFNLVTKYGFFTKDPLVDTCLIIHSPLFNENHDEFIIQYETRFQNNTSYFTTDYYRKKKKKWSFVRSVNSFSF